MVRVREGDRDETKIDGKRRDRDAETKKATGQMEGDGRGRETQKTKRVSNRV